MTRLLPGKKTSFYSEVHRLLREEDSEMFEIEGGFRKGFLRRSESPVLQKDFHTLYLIGQFLCQ